MHDTHVRTKVPPEGRCTIANLNAHPVPSYQCQDVFILSGAQPNRIALHPSQARWLEQRSEPTGLSLAHQRRRWLTRSGRPDCEWGGWVHRAIVAGNPVWIEGWSRQTGQARVGRDDAARASLLRGRRAQLHRAHTCGRDQTPPPRTSTPTSRPRILFRVRPKLSVPWR